MLGLQANIETVEDIFHGNNKRNIKFLKWRSEFNV